MSNLENLFKSLSNLTIMEVVDLVKMLESGWGVSASAPSVVSSAPVTTSTPEPQKTIFDVILTSFGENKLSVIKAVKEITLSDLTSAKVLVESAPKPIKTGIAKEDAEAIKEKLEAVGAKIDIK